MILVERRLFESMKASLAIALLLIAMGCSQKESFEASKLDLEWELVKNNHDGKGNFLAAITLKSDVELPSNGWTIYFSLRYHTTELTSQNSELNITHLNGELFTITPSPTFQPAKSIRMEFTGARKVANFQDVPSGFFFVSDDNIDVAIDLGKPVVTKVNLELPSANAYSVVEEVSNPIKVLPTPVRYTPGNWKFVINSETNVIYDEFKNEGDYLIDEIEKVTGYTLNTTENTTNTIKLVKSSGAAESYSLSVTPDLIIIAAADAAGVFYGIQSLKQLFPPGSWSKREDISIETVNIQDAPRFPVREFMLDVGRNFESKTNILRLLEVMSLYKLNTFHFHFNDDEGWRLEIPGLPELTEVGAKRGYPFASNERLQPAYGSGPTESNHFGTGYYSRADFIEILAYATQRHIQVIPEIESPGHARAAIRAMEARYNQLMNEGKKEEAKQYVLHDISDQSKYKSAQYFRDNAMNVASPSVYAFMDKVIVELKKMYEEAGAPLTTIHMGGDEVADGAWEQSPAIEGYKKSNPSVKTPKDLYADFFVKTTVLLEKHGLKITGWEEMIIEDPHIEATTRKVIDNKKYRDDNVQFDVWWDIYGKQDMCYPIANAGYGVVLTCFDYFYFDLAQSPSFNEPGDAWIGYLGLQKTFSFIPFDIYNSYPLDMGLNPIEDGRYKGKERLSETGKKNIRGIQAALWAENMTYDGYMEYQVLPRLLALAERAWAPDPRWANETGVERTRHFNSDWSSFVNRLGNRELPQLDYYNGGYAYRLPTPFFKIENGKVLAGTEIPGIQIRYTTDGSEPVNTSAMYTMPIDKNGTVRLRAFNTRGRGGESVLVR